MKKASNGPDCVSKSGKWHLELGVVGSNEYVQFAIQGDNIFMYWK